MPADRPVIVVGCPRSGTTMLQLMLHAHPRIAIPPETRIVLNVYRERREFGDLSVPANRRALARRIVDHQETRFCDLGLDAEDVVERITAGYGRTEEPGTPTTPIPGAPDSSGSAGVHDTP